MSSLTDMMSAALAGLLSAALVHFGASDGAERPQKPRPAASRAVDKPGAPAAPTPDDDRFRPANPHVSGAGKTAGARPPAL